jgi:hypothetical protein
MVPIWVYIVDVDGQGLVKVDVGRDCVWSNNSTMIAYTDHNTDVSPVDVHTYELASGTITNLTESVQTEEIMRVYQLPVWSADDSQITSAYTGINFDDLSDTVSGTSTITLVTGVIEDE